MGFQAGGQEQGRPGVQESPAGRRLEGRGLQSQETPWGYFVMIGAIACVQPHEAGLLWASAGALSISRGWDVVIGSIVLIYFSFDVILDL